MIFTDLFIHFLAPEAAFQVFLRKAVLEIRSKFTIKLLCNIIDTSAWVLSCKFTAYFHISEHLFLRKPLAGCFSRSYFSRTPSKTTKYWRETWQRSDPTGIYLLKVNKRNIRTRYKICSKLTIKTPEQRHWHRSSVFIVNFEHISHLVLVFLLLTLNMSLPAGEVCLKNIHHWSLKR